MTRQTEFNSAHTYPNSENPWRVYQGLSAKNQLWHIQILLLTKGMAIIVIEQQLHGHLQGPKNQAKLTLFVRQKHMKLLRHELAAVAKQNYHFQNISGRFIGTVIRGILPWKHTIQILLLLRTSFFEFVYGWENTQRCYEQSIVELSGHAHFMHQVCALIECIQASSHKKVFEICITRSSWYQSHITCFSGNGSHPQQASNPCWLSHSE